MTDRKSVRPDDQKVKPMTAKDQDDRSVELEVEQVEERIAPARFV
jgi:hypothetical protein